ncbi:MAG: hypothetical protein ACTTJZ_04840 [Sphaerochaetaceae bacterium]
MIQYNNITTLYVRLSVGNEDRNGGVGNSIVIMKDMTRWGRDYLQTGNTM